MADDLDAKLVIPGHAVDANVGRVALTDVRRRGAASVTVVVGRRPAQDDDDRQHDRHVPAATPPWRADPATHRQLRPENSSPTVARIRVFYHSDEQTGHRS